MLFGYPEGSVCELPLEWRIRVLEERVRASVPIDLDFVVRAADALPMAEYGALMAEVYSRGDDFPVVRVRGKVVCSNGLDAQAVIAALRGA